MPTPNLVKEVVVVTSYVWCEHEGDAHAATEDPFHYGPQYVYGAGEDQHADDPDWVKRTGNDGDWPGTYWYYVCPGPHLVLFATYDVPADKLPKRGDVEMLDV